MIHPRRREAFRTDGHLERSLMSTAYSASLEDSDFYFPYLVLSFLHIDTDQLIGEIELIQHEHHPLCTS